MGFWEYLDRLNARFAQEQAKENTIKHYNDIGCFLLYDVLYGDIFKERQHLLENQRSPFFIYQCGHNTFVYGAVMALQSDADIVKFERHGTALLKDRGYNVKVKCVKSAVVVTSLN